MNLLVLISCLLSLARAEVEAADPVADAIAAAVRSHVAATARVDSGDVELRWLGLGAAVPCPADAQILVDSRPGEDFRGRTDIRVTMFAGGQECARMKLPTRVAIWQPVHVAVSDAVAGMPVEVVLGRAPRNALRGDLIDPERGTWLALHTIRAGSAVTDRDVVLAPAARAGDSVLLQAVVGKLRIEADAHMLNDGRIGERVRVANKATGTVVDGVLVDARTVRVGGMK